MSLLTIQTNPEEHDPRTRQHIQQVSLLLNSLILSGAITIGGGGTFVTQVDVKRTISVNTTLLADSSRIVAGPLTIESGIVLTIPADSILVVI